MRWLIVAFLITVSNCAEAQVASVCRLEMFDAPNSCSVLRARSTGFLVLKNNRYGVVMCTRAAIQGKTHVKVDFPGGDSYWSHKWFWSKRKSDIAFLLIGRPKEVSMQFKTDVKFVGEPVHWVGYEWDSGDRVVTQGKAKGNEGRFFTFTGGVATEGMDGAPVINKDGYVVGMLLKGNGEVRKAENRATLQDLFGTMLKKMYPERQEAVEKHKIL